MHGDQGRQDEAHRRDDLAAHGPGNHRGLAGDAELEHGAGKALGHGASCNVELPGDFLGSHALGGGQKVLKFFGRKASTEVMSFTYNLGAANLGSSTLLRLLNAGDYAAAAEQFPRWNKAGGQLLAGLGNRRAAERVMFLGAA